MAGIAAAHQYSHPGRDVGEVGEAGTRGWELCLNAEHI